MAGLAPQMRRIRGIPTVRPCRDALASQPAPVCFALIPFEIIDADRSEGFVRVEFAPQPGSQADRAGERRNRGGQWVGGNV